MSVSLLLSYNSSDGPHHADFKLSEYTNVSDLHLLFVQLSLSGLRLVNHRTLGTLVPHVGLV